MSTTLSEDIPASSPYQLESVERALRVLGCFSIETPELRLIDISRRLEISKVQALRLATTLETNGFLTRDPRTKYYRLGLRLFQLGMVAQQQSEVQWIAHPVLHELVELTGETARLMVPHPLGPTCIDLVESPKQRRVFGKLGGPHVWYAGASPKVLLAYQPESVIDQVLGGPLEAFASNTVRDPDMIRAQLAEIRVNGYHVSMSGIEENATGVAAPVFDRSGEIAGSISVSGPTDRVRVTGLENVITWVKAAAGDVSRSLGYGSNRSSQIGQSMHAPLSRELISD
jgi:DNA-binding IclR family transcriptional regulator